MCWQGVLSGSVQAHDVPGKERVPPDSFGVLQADLEVIISGEKPRKKPRKTVVIKCKNVARILV